MPTSSQPSRLPIASLAAAGERSSTTTGRNGPQTSKSATAPKASETEEQRRKLYKRHLDERLDAALKETFPASDAVALTPRRGY